MARKLWRLAALLTVLLAVTDVTTGAEISIVGGNVINIGDKTEIQCSYAVYPFNNPTFIINGVPTDLDQNKDGLGEYAHNSYPIDCSHALFGFCTVHTLTLSSVSRDYNGTTYQCHPLGDTSRKSGIVTLIVRDPATEEPTADKDSTPRTGPPETSPTTDVSLTTSSGASVTQTAEPSSTPEVVNRVNDYAVVTPSDVPPTNTPDNGNTGLVSERVITGASQEPTAGAPSYVNIVVGSVTGVTVYLLTIILIGIVIHFGVKAKKNRSKSNRFPTPPPFPSPPPPLAPGVEMTHNPVYEGIPAPPAYTEHIDFGGNRDVVVNMDVSYHDTLGRKSVAVESLYDYVQ